MMTRKKKTLFEKYGDSETVKDALIPERGKFRKPTKCNCGSVDYKTLAYVTKKSIRVMDNLAKSIALLEARTTANEKTYSGFLKSAQDFNEELAKENQKLKTRLEVMKHAN